jgi:CRP-like cAMP-binding protein
VRAETPVTVLLIERSDFDELVEEGASAASKLACNVIDVLANRLRRMDEWVVSLVQEDQPPEPKTGDWARFRDHMLGGWNL